MHKRRFLWLLAHFFTCQVEKAAPILKKLLKIILIALTIESVILNMEGAHLKIEEFKDVTIAYMRRTGDYGFKNKILMENFKEHLRKENLLNSNSIILGIALDNPADTDRDKLRYDVGLIVSGEPNTALDIRKIPDGMYAVFELPHTEQDVAAFWSNIEQLVGDLTVDKAKPMIERYSADKVAKHLCEFCIPLKTD